MVGSVCVCVCVYIYIQTYNVAPIWADGAFNLNRLKTDKLGTSELALLLQKPTLTQTKRKLPQVPRSECTLCQEMCAHTDKKTQ